MAFSKSGELIRALNKPTFLAVGLNLSNVEKVILMAQPFGVDVNNGCKDENGCKIFRKVKLFTYNAKKIGL